jgi:hypothetical protein
MSAVSQSLNSSSTLYDFTTGSDKFYGAGGAHEIEPGVWGMIGGDGNSDGGVFAEDYLLYRTNQGAVGYEAADFNLDGGVFAEDYLLYRINQGEVSTVPNPSAFPGRGVPPNALSPDKVRKLDIRSSEDQFERDKSVWNSKGKSRSRKPN